MRHKLGDVSPGYFIKNKDCSKGTSINDTLLIGTAMLSLIAWEVSWLQPTDVKMIDMTNLGLHVDVLAEVSAKNVSSVRRFLRDGH
jgi:hypothetical protein